MTDVVVLAGAAVVLAGTLRLTIPVPWGGQIPMGLTLVMALGALLPPGRLAAVGAGGIVLGLGFDRAGYERAGRWTLALLLAGAASAAVDGAVAGEHLLTAATAAATAVVVGEAAWALLRLPGAPTRLWSAVPVLLTLACAAVLLAVAVEEVGVAMAAVAALPLVVTRFAFRRYAEATETLEQTVQALGLVPELAGLAPLGHSERATVYAAAIAGQLGFNRPAVARIVTATRLHHLGAVRHDDTDAPTSPIEVAASGARILRESGFPGGVADLLASARADGYGTSPTLEAAVIRVATSFDHTVGIDAGATDRGLAVLSSVSLDRHGRQAAGALLTLVATRPSLVDDAIAAGDRFRDAAVGLDLEPLVGDQADAALLPFTQPTSSEP